MEIVNMLMSPANLGIIFSLVILEGLLSADNALVLAIMVKHLPPEQRKKALFYGLIGAYAFRFIALGLGIILIKLWWIKLIGAAYLLWLAVKHFMSKSKEEDVNDEKVAKYGFWRTIVAVEMMDIAFSLDSVLAALGVSNKLWVLWVGAILGILMMRGVAQVFVKLIDKFPELENTAYILIGFIGVKMGLTVIDIHMPEWLFMITLALLFSTTFIIHYAKKKHK
jgi:YkoY family integral membrane protein